MSSAINTTELVEYVTNLSDQDLLEDLSHLFEVNIVTSALASTTFGNSYKIPLSAVVNINKAFKVYRDELATRSTDSDRTEDAAYTLLGEYYKCVKAVRSMSRYLDRVVPIISMDFTGKYSELSQHKTSLQFKQDSIGN